MVASDQGEGGLLGLACGDALGEPVDGRAAGRVTAEYGVITEFVGGRVPSDGLTDDTEQTLRLALSLAECGGFCPADAARRFVE